MTRTPRSVLLFLVVALLALAIFPQFAERFYIQLVTKIMIVAIFAMSLDLLVGYTGLVSFGHAAFFGIGGYALAIVARDFELTSLWTTLPIAIAASGIAALVIGWLSIRTSGVYFIMITLAFAQMLFFVVHDNLALGGSDGMYLNSKPTVSIAGIDLVNLRNRTEFYYFTLFSLTASYLFCRMILRSPFGRVIAAIRVNEPRTRALGFPTQRYKLASFVIAGMLGGLAGYLACAQFGFVNPALLSWRESGQALVIVILGGMGTLYGPVVGSFVLILLEDYLSSLTEHWLLVIGFFVIAVVLFLPEGIASLAARGWRRRAGDDDNEETMSAPTAAAGDD
ncbi:MAG TPA: branched-chain amino acid ABC transporter permease [Alphaproteobacteria bacterium]|nr:branched-chain amino acid ABC transporter permease [Alphaproteobacteria bacterium]